MRYLDVAVAFMVGMSAISGISVWNPRQADLTALRYQDQWVLRDRLVAFVDAKGTPWFITAPAAEVCSAAEAASNLTITLSARVDDFDCGTPPPSSVSVQMSFRLGAREVVLLAWSGAAA